MCASNKKFILTADDFGLLKELNFAVLEGVRDGILTSTCVCANGEFYTHAMKEILPKINEVDLGVHLNIIEGKGLLEHRFLTDKTGNFKHGFISLLINSYRKEFLKEIEAEFRAQIEQVLKDAKAANVGANFVNSHVHTHGIPKIFELTARLASEYKIPSVRLQAEKFYRANRPPKLVNIVKVVLLNYFSIINRAMVKKYNLKCNDYILGISYTGEMNKDTILKGLFSLSHFENITVEALLHPTNTEQSASYGEYLTIVDPNLKQKVNNLGFEFARFD